ncbi:MAG: DUF2141 domain-containing protein [Saprospiraceae bacterium]
MYKKINPTFFFLFCFIYTAILNGQNPLLVSSSKGIIKVNFENIQLAKGSIKLALYRSAETFLDTENAAGFYSFKINEKGSLSATINDLEYGEYAIAVFHDENSNGELETNLLGIPTEPYCFSGSGHSKWKPPVYEDAKFVVSENEITLTLRLEKWKL